MGIKRLAGGQAEIRWHFGETVHVGHFRYALTTQEETATDVERLITVGETKQQKWCQIALPGCIL